MRINTLFSIFTPKDTKFLPLLDELASILNNAASIMEQIFQVSDKTVQKEYCLAVKAEELKGDNVSGEIFKALNKTFITPFDREDIHSLADAMDDVIDAMNRVAQKILIYTPKTLLTEHTWRLAAIVKKGAVALQNAVKDLSNLSKTNHIRLDCKEIKRLEEEADMIYEEAIVFLFNNEANASELIKLKEIVQELEKAADKLDTAGKVLSTILVKYS